MATSNKCMVCTTNIVSNSRAVKCSGVCAKFIHVDCAFLDKQIVDEIAANENLHYICDSCNKFSLRALNNRIDGLYQYLFQLSDTNKEILKIVNEKSNNESIKKVNVQKVTTEPKTNNKERGKERGHSTNTDSSHKIAEHTNKCNSNLSTASGGIATNTNTPKLPCNKATTSNASTVSGSVAANTNTPKTRSNKSTTANQQQKRDDSKNDRREEKKQVTKPSNKTPSTKVKERANKNSSKKATTSSNTNKQCAISIQPKTAQDAKTTLRELQRKINPCDFDLKNVIKTPNGTVIIECDKDDEMSNLKSTLESEFSDRYHISTKAPLTPKIKIFGITEQMSEVEIETLLKKQNKVLSNSDIKVLKVVNDYKNNDVFNAIVRVDKTSFKNVIGMKKVLIKWDTCAVKEHFSLMRCHKCSGYAHTHDDCKNELACGYCAKEHNSNDCNETTVSCINCIVANEKFNLELDINHNVWSRKCEILNGKISKIGKKTDYSNE